MHTYVQAVVVQSSKLKNVSRVVVTVEKCDLDENSNREDKENLNFEMMKRVQCEES